MLFNSFEFALFIAPVLILVMTLKHRHQNLFLLAASYFFYGSWDWRFLSLIFLSTVVDYTCALRMVKGSDKQRKWALWTSLGFNLGALGFFKYTNFFIESFADWAGTLGFAVSIPALEIILPVGISFYTFQTLSYTIDVYRGQTTPTRNFFNFALYVAFFPQLVAGPIEKSRRFLPQVENERQITRQGCLEGAYLILWGLFKKVVVADRCAIIVTRVFHQDGFDPTALELLVGAYAFSWQIYCDFSGYTDIARGVAKTMGFDLMLNFRMPYFSPNLADFWRRWHISLSTWFKEYLYIPLGGNRVNKGRLAFNLMTVFVVSGLWHGAAMNFVVWGALHGIGLVVLTFGARPIERLKSLFPAPVWGVLAVLFTFHYVVFAFSIWQPATVTQWWSLVETVFTDWSTSRAGWKDLFTLMGLVALPMGVQWAQFRKDDPMLPLSWPAWGRFVFYLVLLIAVIRFGVFDGEQFIYFQF